MKFNLKDKYGEVAMRKIDREVTCTQELLSIIERCETCRIGFSHNNIPYIVPMNYGYTYENDQLILYFHSGLSGKKLEMIKLNNEVCFQMDCSCELVPHEIPCRYTMKFESIIGHGKIYILTEENEKIEALKHVMKKYAPDKNFDFEAKHAKIILGLKLVVEEFTGKRSTKGGSVGEVSCEN